MDRLLGELHIPKDSAAGREHLENYVEERRAQENDAEFKPIRRGWCLGDETFRQELLEQAARASENHFAGIRRETAEEKALGILREELENMGWQPIDLDGRAKGDPGKVRIARRIRQETTVTLNLNSAIETANHAKYAKGKGFWRNASFTHWVKCFGNEDSRSRLLFSRISRGSRLIPTAVSKLKWIAEQLQMGTWTHVSNLLQPGKEGNGPEKQMGIDLV